MPSSYATSTAVCLCRRCRIVIDLIATVHATMLVVELGVSLPLTEDDGDNSDDTQTYAVTWTLLLRVAPVSWCNRQSLVVIS